MRASLTAARLKYRMRAIMLFRASAPLEDRMSALRRVKRWCRRASRRAMGSLFQILAHETPEERRSDLLRIFRHRLAIECGNSTCGAA
jgi:hypothetical protein